MKLLIPNHTAVRVFFSVLILLSTEQTVLLAAFSATAQWDVRSTATAADVNGGGFDTGVAGFPTDGAATVATTSAPVFTSASYNFVAGDVNAWIYIGAGTNWIQGWYKIASVASNAATLTAGIGTATLSISGSPTGPNIAVGCATTASPTGATWGIDYSQQDAAQIAFTDMVIGGTTTTFTSVLKPVGKNFVGNIINVVSGTGFTVQRVAVVSTSATVATCDKSLGTTLSTGGNGNLGGGLITIAKATSLTLAVTNVSIGNTIHIKAGTYTLTATINSNSGNWQMVGYQTSHNDGGTKPLITTSTNSTILMQHSNAAYYVMQNLSFSNTAAVRAVGLQATGIYPFLSLINCILDGFTIAVDGSNGAANPYNFVSLSGVEIKNCSSHGVYQFFDLRASGSNIHNNTGDGLNYDGSNAGRFWVVEKSLLVANGGKGLNISGSGTTLQLRVSGCTIANNLGDGIGQGAGSLSYASFENNLIYANGGWGINLLQISSLNELLSVNRNNGYGANIAGALNNLAPGLNNVSLTASPFSGGTTRSDSDFAPHNMTTNSSDAPFVASASSSFSASFLPYKAFDGVVGASGTNWLGTGNGVDWLQLDTGNASGYLLASYAIAVNTQPEPTRAPKNWTMQGSNDGSSWTTLDTQTNQTGWTSGQTRTFTIGTPGTTFYRYFRVNITANNGDVNTQICELYLTGHNTLLDYTNFALNSTAGGGLLLKQAGFPGVFPGGLSTGYLDVGAVQTSGAPGSGGAFTAAFTQ